MIMPSVLWHCWLGIRESLRSSVNEVGVGVVICLEQGADCLHMVHLMPLHPKTPLSLASFKSRLVLHFQCQLTEVVLEKRPLNRYNSSSSSSTIYHDILALLCMLASPIDSAVAVCLLAIQSVWITVCVCVWLEFSMKETGGKVTVFTRSHGSTRCISRSDDWLHSVHMYLLHFSALL